MISYKKSLGRLFFARENPATNTLYFFSGLSVILISLFSVILWFSVSSFPDYSNYQHYITSGDGIARWKNEPISILLMWLSHSLGLDARNYYFIVWSVALILMVVQVFLKKCSVSLAVFFLINPAAVVLLQTPRQFLSYVFFCMLITSWPRFKILYLLLSVITHTVGGVFSLITTFLLSFPVKWLWLPIFIFLPLIIYLVYQDYSRYFTGTISFEDLRGRLRYLYFLSISFLGLLVFSKNKKIFVLFSSLIFLMTSIYMVSEFAGRIFVYAIAMIGVVLYRHVKLRENLILTNSFFVLSGFFSVLVALSGSFGY